MGIFRILGLIGSASCLSFLVHWSIKEGFPNQPVEKWAFISLFLTVFNFFPVSGNLNKFPDNLTHLWSNSLIGLWIEAKKAKLRKEIDG